VVGGAGVAGAVVVVIVVVIVVVVVAVVEIESEIVVETDPEAVVGEAAFAGESDREFAGCRCW
jgi:hypothetical protein